jgi:hypothetical protein
MMCGDSLSTVPKVVYWNQMVESVRKGIERVNGVVKGRFRYFMLPITLHDAATIDDLFFLACALHNWRLQEDGISKDSLLLTIAKLRRSKALTTTT